MLQVMSLSDMVSFPSATCGVIQFRHVPWTGGTWLGASRCDRDLCSAWIAYTAAAALLLSIATSPATLLTYIHIHCRLCRALRQLPT